MWLDAKVADTATEWLFRERLVKAKAIDGLFVRSDASLTYLDYLRRAGRSSMPSCAGSEAAQHRNSEDKKAAIKQGKIQER